MLGQAEIKTAGRRRRQTPLRRAKKKQGIRYIKEIKYICLLKEDIPLLGRHFADKQTETYGLPRVEFASDGLEFMQRLPFPGNIRELKNLVERTILVSGKPRIGKSDFEANAQASPQPLQARPASLEGLTLEELEKQTILQSLEQHNGNLSKVASSLGISRAALYRRLEKYGIPTDK